MAREDICDVSPAEFERLVAEALDGIPDELARYLENVAVVIEEAPSRALLRAEGIDPRHDTLYGLYEGVPLDERPHDFAGQPPDRITIFRAPLLEDCRNRDELREEVRITVVHEIAHFFGMDDDHVRRLGY
jgi:predicted Zn-dependent protease with MMP-like domain